MKKIVSFTALFLLLFNAVFCQDREKEILNKKISGIKNFKAIMNEVEKHFAKERKEKERKKRTGIKEEEEFENDYLHWKRWENFYQTRLTANGELEDVNKKTIAAWQKVTSKYDVQNRILSGTNAIWSYLGPFQNNYQGGFFRGLSRIDRIVFHPTNANMLFAGAPNGGIWKSSDNGTSWLNTSFYFPINSVAGIAISQQNPLKMYVITGDAIGGGMANGIPSNNSCGIWLTNDGGITWSLTNFSSDREANNLNGYKLIVHPTNDNIVLAATRFGLYRTINGGNNWTRVITTGINDIEFDPSDPSIVYATGFNTFYYSLDNGATFPVGQRTNISGANRIEIAVTPANSNYVYLVCGPYGGPGTNTFGGVYRSTNKGVNFTLRTNTPNILCSTSNGIRTATENDQSGYDLAIAANPSNAEDIFVGGKIVWRSTNGGTTFINNTIYNETTTSAFPDGNYIHPDIQDLAFNPLNSTLYAGTDGGVYRTTDFGINWIPMVNIQATTFNHMAAASYDVNKVMGGCQDNGVKYKKDAGDFTHITGADGFDCSFGNAAAVGMYASVNDKLLRFNSSGTEIAMTTPAGTSFYPVIIADPVNTNTVYMSSNGTGVQKSTNNGSSWTQVLNQSLGQSIAMSAANGNRVYVTSTNRIFRTDDGGTTWSTNLTNNPGFLAGSTISDINVCPSNSDLVFVTLGGYDANEKVMYSDDAGATWTNVSGTLPEEVKVNCVVTDIFNNAYIGTDMGVYYQANTSTEWTPFYNELPRVPVYDLAINQNAQKIRAGTFGNGIWETSLYNTCDFNLVLNDPIIGSKFYQVSNQITSNASVEGGELTNVVIRAGNEIVLQSDFIAHERTSFIATIGPCESGIVNKGSNAKKNIPDFIFKADKGDNSGLYIYGQVFVQNKKNKAHTLKIKAFKPGNFQLIVSGLDDLTPLVKKDIRLQKDELHEMSVNSINIPGKYYVQLNYEGILVHVQELYVE